MLNQSLVAPKKKSPIRYVMGIDAGKNTGFAVYDRDERKLVTLETLSFESCLYKILHEFDAAIIVVEKPRSNTVWGKKFSDTKGSRRKSDNVAAKVGGVSRESTLLIQSLKYFGEKMDKDYEVRAVHPQGKKDAAMFNRITGWTGRSNSHTRDAGLLCFGI